MKYIELANESTDISWWDEARKELNKAIKAYNKFIDEGITKDKLFKRVKKSYTSLIESGATVDYSNDFNLMIRQFPEF